MKKNKASFHIALDVSQMVYSGHGVGRYSEELARALLLHAPANYSFTYFAGALRQAAKLRLRRKQHPWSRASWKTLPLPPRLAPLFWHTTNLSLNTFLGRSDLIHLSDWTTPRANSPLVTTVHDLVFKLYPETVHPLVLKTQKKRLERAIKYNAHFIADSKNTKNDLMKIFKLDSSRITVVYPGISARFEPRKKIKVDQMKERYGLPDQYLLTLATREPRKNLPRLIKAYQSLKKTDPSLPPLVIAGRYGWGKDEKPSADVIITGYIKEFDLPALYSGASVFVYPSLYEGFGFPVLEAMACGVSVVTSNTSSLPEVAGKAAVLVDPKSVKDLATGIARALKERKSLSKKSLTQAKKFSWEKTAQETLAVYTAILNNSKTESHQS